MAAVMLPMIGVSSSMAPWVGHVIGACADSVWTMLWSIPLYRADNFQMSGHDETWQKRYTHNAPAMHISEGWSVGTYFMGVVGGRIVWEVAGKVIA